MRSPRSTPVKGSDSGYFIIRVRPQGDYRWHDVTTVRNIPTKVVNYSTTDPFGPSAAQVEFPGITSFDTFGYGDIFWLKEWTDISISWSSGTWSWEGHIASIEVGGSVSVQCRGFLYILDNTLATPLYPINPVPYETLIRRATSSLGLRIEFPPDWNTKVTLRPESYLAMLNPQGLKKGDTWTGLATRATGAWEPYLTGHIQNLLGTMYTPEGDQWTLMTEKRLPVLRVRKQVHHVQPDTIRVTNGTPGVQVSLSKDWSQSANIIYGAGTDFAGVGYSNMQVYGDGTTRYEPFAFANAAYPHNNNPHRDKSVVPKEARLNFQQGIDEISALSVAQSHLQRFSDPGWTGTVTLSVDPLRGDSTPMNRYLIEAGATLLVESWCGGNVFLHVTQSSVSPEDGTVTLTVDSRYRDALTVEEVKARTRDALDPTKALRVGVDSLTVQDLILPWSYADGSGMIPLTAKELFTKQFTNSRFPWIEATKARPPIEHPDMYVRVGPYVDLSNNITLSPPEDWPKKGPAEGTDMRLVGDFDVSTPQAGVPTVEVTGTVQLHSRNSVSGSATFSHSGTLLGTGTQNKTLSGGTRQTLYTVKKTVNVTSKTQGLTVGFGLKLSDGKTLSMTGVVEIPPAVVTKNLYGDWTPSATAAKRIRLVARYTVDPPKRGASHTKVRGTITLETNHYIKQKAVYSTNSSLTGQTSTSQKDVVASAGTPAVLTTFTKDVSLSNKETAQTIGAGIRGIADVAGTASLSGKVTIPPFNGTPAYFSPGGTLPPVEEDYASEGGNGVVVSPPPNWNPFPAWKPESSVDNRKEFWSKPFPIRMSQKGTIRATQVAAVDKNGNPVKVEFHLGIYDNTISYRDMPRPSRSEVPRRDDLVGNDDYYPFFPNAFLEFNPDGTIKSDAGSLVAGGANLVVGWGTYDEPAGYWPGSAPMGTSKTGQLVDEASWSFDTTSQTQFFDPQQKDETQESAKRGEAGHLWGIIYCDDYKDINLDEVFFIGRLWLAPEGTG